MEVEVQSQKMFENIASNLSDGLLRDARKHCIAKFLEECCSNSSRAVCNVPVRRVCLHWVEGFLQAMIIEPATVYAVPPTEAKSTFMESTMLLK